LVLPRPIAKRGARLAKMSRTARLMPGRSPAILRAKLEKLQAISAEMRVLPQWGQVLLRFAPGAEAGLSNWRSAQAAAAGASDRWPVEQDSAAAGMAKAVLAEYWVRMAWEA
jgi:hypothetical protein